jgi:hypothetical protein
VSSLDHVRRERVAQRLVDLAADRQVIVFTHDISFVVDLKRSANRMDVPVAERWIVKRDGIVGKTDSRHPWRAKLVGEKLNDLETQLAAIRRVENGEPHEYERLARSWYQDLRTVWERMIEEYVVGRVLDRGQLEIRSAGFGVLVQIDETDNLELDTAFKRCGEMGSHDPSEYLNRPAPLVEELEEDLRNARVWGKRVKRYNS